MAQRDGADTSSTQCLRSSGGRVRSEGVPGRHSVPCVGSTTPANARTAKSIERSRCRSVSRVVGARLRVSSSASTRSTMPPVQVAPEQAQTRQSTFPPTRAMPGRPRKSTALVRTLKTGVPGGGAYQRAPDAPLTSSQLRAIRARKVFLRELAAGKPVAAAARASGMTAPVFYRWRDADLEFRAEWEDALQEGLDAIEDRIVDASKRDWRAGVRVLEAYRPQVWGRRRVIEAAPPDVTLNVGTLDETRQRVAELERKLLGEAAPSPIAEKQ